MEEKVFVKTKVRLGAVDKIYNDGTFEYFTIYYNEGYIVLLQNSRFVGLMGEDRLEGYYKEDSFGIVLENIVHNEISLINDLHYDWKKLNKTRLFEAEGPLCESFQVPMDIFLFCSKKLCVDIELIEVERNTFRQNEIWREIQNYS